MKRTLELLKDCHRAFMVLGLDPNEGIMLRLKERIADLQTMITLKKELECRCADHWPKGSTQGDQGDQDR
jgi:hypothetical protein